MDGLTNEQRRITFIEIERYRSVNNRLRVDVPSGVPLVLVGENNAGKSNIIRALDLVLGERWPKSHEPEDHEFWNRDTDNSPITVKVGLDGVQGSLGSVRYILWEYSKARNADTTYDAVYAQGTRRWVSNEIRDQCMVVFMEADRKLSYQMSYTTKWTLLAKLMRRFHDRLVADNRRVNRLKSKFGEIKDIFEEVEEFAQFRVGLQSYFDDMLAGMSYGLGIDFSAYDPSNYFHSLKVFPQQDGEPRNFGELGTGQEQVLAFAFAHAYAKAFFGGIVLVVEEPEAHLHPLAQAWLARKIREMARDGLQVVITTHSPAFVGIMDLPGLVLIRKQDGATIAKQLDAQLLTECCVQNGARPDRTLTSTVLPFYAGNATTEIVSGLFAKKVVLVEGPTEQLSLPIYLAKVGLDVEKEGIAIIPVMGKGNIAKWWRFFSAYNMPVYFIFDNDARDDENGSRRHDALKSVALDIAAAESFISSAEWHVEPAFAVFGTDYEKTMRASFRSYSELEDEGRELLGDTKPIVARYAADRLEVNETDIGWQKMTELKDAIAALGSRAGNEQSEDDIPF